MSFVAVGVGVGGAVVGGLITSGSNKQIAGMQQASADKQAEVALALGEKAHELDTERLEFEMGRYQDWKDVFGGMQENMAAYYENLTPEFYENLGLDAIEGQFDVVRESTAQALQQRGLTGSGLDFALSKDISMDEATAKYKNAQQAEQTVRNEKQNFLSLGLGINPANNVSNAMAQSSANAHASAGQATNLAANAQNVATQFQNQTIQQNNAAIGDILNIGMTGLSDYYASKRGA